MKFLTHSFFIPTEYNVSGSAIEAQKEKSLQTGTMCQMDYVGRRMGCCHLRVRLPPDRRETRVLVADATLVIPAHYFLRSALSPAVACVTIIPISHGGARLHQVMLTLNTMQL